jgi:RimJ/RimL family protein N-acetyltransferase
LVGIYERDYWGQGYITEAAKVILEYGLITLQLPIIYAVVNPDNYRSIRVSERLGMQSMGLTNKYYDTEALLFSIEA